MGGYMKYRVIKLYPGHGGKIGDIIDNMDYNFDSNTDNSVITDTEILDYDIISKE